MTETCKTCHSFGPATDAARHNVVSHGPLSPGSKLFVDDGTKQTSWCDVSYSGAISKEALERVLSVYP
jgi:hypothetical protein